jgi:hypothetical protein
MAFENGLRFQIQIEDLDLKSLILRENSNNRTSGSTLHAGKCPISPHPLPPKTEKLG